jgi:hypothetical protein
LQRGLAAADLAIKAMAACRCADQGDADVLTKVKAWLVTGPVGRGVSFALDFAVALRQIVARRRRPVS